MRPGQPPQAGAQRGEVADRAVQLDRFPQAVDRPLRGSDRVALDAVLFEQFRALPRREPVGVLEHRTEMGDGLAVSTGPGRIPGRGRTVCGDGILVACLRRVMNDLRHVNTVPGHQRGEHALVQRHQPRRWHGARDGAPGELVPETRSGARTR